MELLGAVDCGFAQFAPVDRAEMAATADDRHGELRVHVDAQPPVFNSPFLL